MFNDAPGVWCEEHGIPFIRIYPYLAEESGLLKQACAMPNWTPTSADVVFFANAGLAKFYPEAFGCE